MNSAPAVNNLSCICETYDANVRSSGSSARSRADKGQSFADSLPLAKARAENKPDKDAASDNEDVAGSGSQEEAHGQPAAQKVAGGKAGTTATRSQRSGKGGDKATRSDPSEAQTQTAGAAATITVDPSQQPQQVVEPTVDQLVDSPLTAQPQAQADQSLTPATPAQDASAQAVAAQLTGKGRQPAEGEATGVVMRAPAHADSGKGAVEAVSSAGANPTDTGAATESNATTVVPNATPQGQAVQAANAEASHVDPKAVDPSTRIPAADKDSSVVQGPKHAAPTQANPQSGTQTAAKQNNDDSPQTTTQDDRGSSRPVSTESTGSSVAFSVNKDDLQVVQKGQDAQTGSPAAPSELNATAESRPLTQAGGAKPETAVFKSPSQDLTEQLGSAVRASLNRPDKQLTISLRPPELGSVVVRFEGQGQQIRAVIEVSRAETGKDIEQALPQLIKSLQDAGLHIRKFDVVVSDSLGRDAGGNSTGQDGSNQQQTWSGTGNHPDGTLRPTWSRWDEHSQDQTDSSRAFNSQRGPSQGIDLLV